LCQERFPSWEFVLARLTSELVPFFKPRAGENKQRFSGACEWFG
jgi:hypothetical protein